MKNQKRGLMTPEKRNRKYILNCGVEMADRAYHHDDVSSVRQPTSDEIKTFENDYEDVIRKYGRQKSLDFFKSTFEKRLNDRIKGTIYTLRGELYEELYKYCENV